MVNLRNGLGDAYYYEAMEVAEEIKSLEVGDETSFTYDNFLSEQLYDTVIEGFNILGMQLYLTCGVNRWYSNKEKTDMFNCDFRNDIIIVKRVKQ